jgi:hypothetical protein
VQGTGHFVETSMAGTIILKSVLEKEVKKPKRGFN